MFLQPLLSRGIVRGKNGNVAEALLTTDGIRLGRYQLRELIGAGSLGSVYRATIIGDTVEVAFRLLSPRLADDPTFSARLEAFGGSLAALDHPALNSVLDWGIECGQPFLVTTLERGTPLDRIDLGRLPLSTRIGLVAQAFEAIRRLHQLGVVHGDLRPANLALREDGTLGITDPALALWLGSAPRAGSPYLSPECVTGGPVTPAADCFALGVVLYQALTGTLPGLHPTPPSGFRADLPPELDGVTRQLLDPDPERRLASAAAGADALRPFASCPPTRRTAGAPSGAPAEAASARARTLLGSVPRPPFVASLLTALVIGILAAATVAGTRASARIAAAIPSAPALMARSELAEPTPATTPTLPIVAALPPPVVITAGASLTGAGGGIPAVSGTMAITAYGALTATSPSASSAPLTSAGALTGARPVSTPSGPNLAPPPHTSPDSLLYVVSQRQGVPDGYVPADLVPIDGYVTVTRSGVRLRRVVLDAFRRMTDAMRAAGLEPAVAGGYLSPAEQREAYAALVAQHGQRGAEQLAPRPGYDERQLGTVVAFVSATHGHRLNDQFNDSPEGRWLLANAPKYGFIQSYPVGKDAVLGLKARPWQYRYVGDLAYDIASRGQTLDEYLAARR
jgi:serine/threonine-protein kinase